MNGRAAGLVVVLALAAGGCTPPVEQPTATTADHTLVASVYVVDANTGRCVQLHDGRARFTTVPRRYCEGRHIEASR